MTDPKLLQKTIEAVIRGRINDARIVSVDVRPDVDHDGDPILRVRVIYDNDKERLEARVTSSMTSHVWSKLREIGEEAFPIISYAALSEIKRTKAAAP